MTNSSPEVLLETVSFDERIECSQRNSSWQSMAAALHHAGRL